MGCRPPPASRALVWRGGALLSMWIPCLSSGHEWRPSTIPGSSADHNSGRENWGRGKGPGLGPLLPALHWCLWASGQSDQLSRLALDCGVFWDVTSSHEIQQSPVNWDSWSH